MKQYRVYQTITIFVEAENESKAVDKVRDEPSTYENWTKWEVEDISDVPNDVIDFYPPIKEKK